MSNIRFWILQQQQAIPSLVNDRATKEEHVQQHI